MDWLLSTAPTWATLLGFLAATCSAGMGGVLFRPGGWYRTLAKPAWTPPDWLFPIAWTLLYVAMAVAAPMALFRRAHLEGAILAASLWGLVICRLALIALIDVSAFPAMTKYYLGPAIILVIPAALCSIFSLLEILGSHERFPLRKYLARA